DGTMRVLPSLISGTVVDSVRPTGPATLLLFRNRYSETWRDGLSLFSELHRAGIGSAMVGWYLPYCATFEHSLESCWTAPVGVRRQFLREIGDQFRTAFGLPLSPDKVNDWVLAHAALIDHQRS